MTPGKKRLAWIAAVPLLCAALAAGVLIGGNTDPGRALIERTLYRLSAGRVRLAGLQGRFPSHLNAAQLQIGDSAGVWLTAEHLTVDWTPLALFRGRVQVENLAAARVTVSRAPITTANTRSEPVSIPDIDVAQADLAVVELGAALAGASASLRMHGRMRLRSLEDAETDLLARRIDGDGDYELHFRFDRTRMDGRLKLHEPAGGPLENLVGVPGLGALSAEASVAGLRRAEKVELTVQAGGLRAQAQGELNVAEGSADLAYSLAAPAMQPRSDLGWGALALSGTWRGTVRAPVANGQVRIDDLHAGAGFGASRINAELTADKGALEVRGSVDEFRIPGPRPQLLQHDPLRISARMDLGQPGRPMHLTAATKLASLEAQVMTAGRQRAELSLRVAELAPFTALIGADESGTALIKAQMERVPAGGGKITANAILDLTGSPSHWRSAFGERPTLSVAGDWNDRAFSIGDARLAGHDVDARLSGEAARAVSGAIDRLKLRWELTAAQLADWSPALAGTLRAAGELQGTPSSFAVDGLLHTSVSVRGSSRGELAARVNIHGLPAAPIASLRVSGLLDDAALDIDGEAGRERDGGWHAQVRRADWKSAHLQGDVTTGAAAAQTQGRVELHVAQVADLDRLLGVNLRGSFDLSGKGSGDALALKLGARLERAAAIADTTATAAAEVRASTTDVRVTAAASMDLRTRALRVTSWQADAMGQSLRLRSPSLISFADGIAVDRLEFGVQQARIEAAGTVYPILALHASLRGVRPALIDVLAPDLLSDGELTAQADLRGTVARPEGHARLDAVGVRFASDAASALPAVDLHATAELDGEAADLHAQLSAGKKSALLLSGRTPLAAGGVLALNLSGSLDAALVSPLIEARGLQASGELAFEATVAGTPAAPDISGTISLSKGTLRDYVRGFSLSEMSAQLSGSQGALHIDRFAARAGSGTVSMSGSIGLLEPQLPLALEIKAKGAQPIASSLLTATLDADIRVAGTARARLDVAGTVDVSRATIGIPSTLPPNVAVLDVRRRGAKAPPPRERPLVVGLNIAVRAPKEILVQGRGLDAELGGDLEIGGTVAEPLASGGFDLLRGGFSIAGSSLKFTSGRVSFDGAGLRSKLDPNLDFTAEATLSDGTATLRITGLADSPIFDFSSNPPLPQDEIMAQLLFGVQSASQLTSLQVAQIGAALAIMSGVGGNGSFNPLVKIQKALNLDRLNVGSNPSATAAGAANATSTANAGYNVSAGRYLSKRVYVEAKQSTTGSTQVQVDIDLTKHLKLQTRLGNGTAITQGTTPDNDPGSSVGFTYQIEY